MVTRVDKYLGGLGIDATGKLEVTDNASVVVGNGSTTGNVYAGTINSGGVELRANDYATLLSARSNDGATLNLAYSNDGSTLATALSNDFNTYSVVLGGITGANTAILNLQTGLSGANTNLSDNVAIFSGAFTGSNTRLSGAESNVIALQGGLSGANTVDVNQTTGMSGTNTNLAGNVAIFTGAFSGTNTNLSGNVAIFTGAFTGTNTNLADNVAIFTGAFTGSNTRLSGAESNVIALQGGLSGANTINSTQATAITNLTTGLTGANTNISAITSSPVTFQSSVTILGNLTLSGNTTIVTSNTISFGDTLLSLGANNTVSDNLDIGLYGHYWNGTANSHSGIFRSAVSKDWMLFANYIIDLEGNSTVTISNSSFQLGTLRLANANAGFNVSAANAILGTSVYSGTVELRANDYATYLMAKGGIDAANTINTNQTTGLTGANTNITNLTSGLTGANTNITALTGGLAGANTAIALRALAASPTLTGNATFDTNTLFVDSVNKRVGLITTLPGFTLDVRGTANTGALTSTTVSSGGVELRANDYATYLMVLGGLSGANTSIAAKAPTASPTFTGTVTTPNLTLSAAGGIEGGQLDFANAVTNTTITTGIAIDIYGDQIRFFEKGANTRGAYINLAAATPGVGSNLLAGSGGSETSNVIALQGGLAGSNTRLAGAESNVIALQGGLAGANTINTNQTSGLTGANTNITALTGGLAGANTNITALTGGLAGANTAIALRALADSPTFTGNATFDTTTLFVDSLNDRVGIGTTSPTAKFHVAGTGTTARIIVESTGTTGSNLPSLYFNRTSNVSSGADFQGALVWSRTLTDSTSITSSIQSLGTNISGSQEMNLTYNAYTSHQFQIAASEKMRINSSGNVGIGTSSPSDALSVARSSGEAVISITNSGTASSWLTLSPGSSGSAYIHNTGNTSTIFTTNGTERMRIDSSGNVGVGTTSTSTYKLNVNGVANFGIASGVYGNNADMRLETSTGRGWRMGTTSTGSTHGYFYIQGSTDNFVSSFITGLFIDTSGNVGIGTSSPAYKLDVHGTANVGALTTSGTVTLGSNTNVKITGGSSGQYLQTDGSGNLSYVTVQGVPVASIIMYGANTAPSGWLTCDGTAVSRSTYAALFAVVSNVFGIGDNTTTFNLPDFRGRSPYGVDASQSITIGASSAGKINVNFQTATGTGTSGSTADTNTVTTSTTNSTTDKDVTNSITVVTGVTPIAHTHTIPALTVTHPAEVVQFIIKT